MKSEEGKHAQRRKAQGLAEIPEPLLRSVPLTKAKVEGGICPSLYPDEDEELP